LAEIFEQYMDDFGPERIILVHDTKTGMKGMLVIDNTARGPGKGGCRMAPDLTLSTVARLARTMTWKWAMVDIFMGGAKAGIVADPKSPNKEEIVRAYIKALKEYIPSQYVFGLDMGLNERDAAVVVDELGDMGGAIGTPAELGGLPYDQLGLTGYGVAVAASAIAENMNRDLRDTAISIQGFGAVGFSAAKFLAERGANIVAISSVDGALYDPNGLDIEKLGTLREKAGDRAVLEYSAKKAIPLGKELTVNCDILIPAAKQDVITSENVKNVKAKIVIEAANMPTSSEAQEYLHGNGTFLLPDFIANAGAVIGGGIAMDMRHSVNRIDKDDVYRAIEKKMSANAKLVLEESRRLGALPRNIVLNMAKERVLKAMEQRGRISSRAVYK